MFAEDVLKVVRTIPWGKTLTYAEVARAVGRPNAYRAVGNVLHRIWQTDGGRTIPCHRVMRSDGTPGGYAGGTPAKIQRLAKERREPNPA